MATRRVEHAQLDEATVEPRARLEQSAFDRAEWNVQRCSYLGIAESFEVVQRQHLCRRCRERIEGRLQTPGLFRRLVRILRCARGETLFPRHVYVCAGKSLE